MTDKIDFDDSEYTWPPGEVPGVAPADVLTLTGTVRDLHVAISALIAVGAWLDQQEDETWPRLTQDRFLARCVLRDLRTIIADLAKIKHRP